MAKRPQTLREWRGLPSRAAARAEYEQRRAADPQLSKAKQLRSTARWRKVRLRKLSRDPFCELCPKGRPRAASQVHHLQPIVKRPDLAFTMSNLQSVCPPCHAIAEQEARA